MLGGCDVPLERQRQLTIKERNEFLASPLRPQGQSDSGQTVNGIEAEEDVIVLEGPIIRDNYIEYREGVTGDTAPSTHRSARR